MISTVSKQTENYTVPSTVTYKKNLKKYTDIYTNKQTTKKK